MENKVVAHMKDGTIHKGVTQDFDPERDGFYLLPAEGGGVPVRIDFNMLKALFYVKDYVGNSDFVARRGFEEANMSGRRVVLTFLDGEQMWGTVTDMTEDDKGFYFYPSDGDDNNIRVFVIRSSLKEMRAAD